MKFIIEHLEKELYDWCLIEYGHISRIVGKNNLIFTNISSKKGRNRLRKYGTVYGKDISGLNLKKVCVLSQYAKKTLKKSDSKLDYFVFGGILGDKPDKKRTIILVNRLKKSNAKFETRNLGTKQMPTDVSVYVAKKVLDGKKLSDFKFVDELEIEINETESVTLPFRYIVDSNEVVINEKLVEYLRKRKEF